MSGSLTTDESRWPIVIHTTIGVPSEAEVEAFMRRADEILARRAVHAVVFDNSQAGPVPGYMRRSTVEWLSRNREELERYCVGTALVIRSAALRFLMTTVMLVSSHRLEQEVFASLDPAIAWCEQRLRQRA
ncbi:MAG TPA: hypothetical protein VIL20_22760 [Sandaracinaceae bacterium]